MDGSAPLPSAEHGHSTAVLPPHLETRPHASSASGAPPCSSSTAPSADGSMVHPALRHTTTSLHAASQRSSRGGDREKDIAHRHSSRRDAKESGELDVEGRSHHRQHHHHHHRSHYDEESRRRGTEGQQRRDREPEKRHPPHQNLAPSRGEAHRSSRSQSATHRHRHQRSSTTGKGESHNSDTTRSRHHRSRDESVTQKTSSSAMEAVGGVDDRRIGEAAISHHHTHRHHSRREHTTANNDKEKNKTREAGEVEKGRMDTSRTMVRTDPRGGEGSTPNAVDSSLPAGGALQPVQHPSAQQQPVQLPSAQQPVQHVPAQQQPVQHAPAQQQPVQHAPTQQQPVQHPSAQQQPVQHPSAQQQPVQHAPTQQQSVQHAPAQQQPVQHAPAQQQPVQHAPAQQQPVQHAPAQQQPVQHAPTQQQPVQHAPAQQQPVQHAPTQQQPVQHAPAHQQPVQHAPTQQQPVQHPSAQQPVQHAPAHQQPVQHAPTQQQPVQLPSAQQQPHEVLHPPLMARPTSAPVPPPVSNALEPKLVHDAVNAVTPPPLASPSFSAGATAITPTAALPFFPMFPSSPTMEALTNAVQHTNNPPTSIHQNDPAAGAALSPSMMLPLAQQQMMAMWMMWATATATAAAAGGGGGGGGLPGSAGGLPWASPQPAAMAAFMQQSFQQLFPQQQQTPAPRENERSETNPGKVEVTNAPSPSDALSNTSGTLLEGAAPPTLDPPAAPVTLSTAATAVSSAQPPPEPVPAPPPLQKPSEVIAASPSVVTGSASTVGVMGDAPPLNRISSVPKEIHPAPPYAPADDIRPLLPARGREKRRRSAASFPAPPPPPPPELLYAAGSEFPPGGFPAPPSYHPFPPAAPFPPHPTPAYLTPPPPPAVPGPNRNPNAFADMPPPYTGAPFATPPPPPFTEPFLPPPTPLFYSSYGNTKPTDSNRPKAGKSPAPPPLKPEEPVVVSRQQRQAIISGWKEAQQQDNMPQEQPFATPAPSFDPPPPSPPPHEHPPLPVPRTRSASSSPPSNPVSPPPPPPAPVKEELPVAQDHTCSALPVEAQPTSDVPRERSPPPPAPVAFTEWREAAPVQRREPHTPEQEVGETDQNIPAAPPLQSHTSTSLEEMQPTCALPQISEIPTFTLATIWGPYLVPETLPPIPHQRYDPDIVLSERFNNPAADNQEPSTALHPTLLQGNVTETIDSATDDHDDPSSVFFDTHQQKPTAPPLSEATTPAETGEPEVKQKEEEQQAADTRPRLRATLPLPKLCYLPLNEEVDSCIRSGEASVSYHFTSPNSSDPKLQLFRRNLLEKLMFGILAVSTSLNAWASPGCLDGPMSAFEQCLMHCRHRIGFASLRDHGFAFHPSPCRVGAARIESDPPPPPVPITHILCRRDIVPSDRLAKRMLTAIVQRLLAHPEEQDDALWCATRMKYIPSSLPDSIPSLACVTAMMWAKAPPSAWEGGAASRKKNAPEAGGTKTADELRAQGVQIMRQCTGWSTPLTPSRNRVQDWWAYHKEQKGLARELQLKYVPDESNSKKRALKKKVFHELTQEYIPDLFINRRRVKDPYYQELLVREVTLDFLSFAAFHDRLSLFWPVVKQLPYFASTPSFALQSLVWSHDFDSMCEEDQTRFQLSEDELLTAENDSRAPPAKGVFTRTHKIIPEKLIFTPPTSKSGSTDASPLEKEEQERLELQKVVSASQHQESSSFLVDFLERVDQNPHLHHLVQKYPEEVELGVFGETGWRSILRRVLPSLHRGTRHLYEIWSSYVLLGKPIDEKELHHCVVAEEADVCFRPPIPSSCWHLPPEETASNDATVRHCHPSATNSTKCFACFPVANCILFDFMVRGCVEAVRICLLTPHKIDFRLMRSWNGHNVPIFLCTDHFAMHVHHTFTFYHQQTDQTRPLEVPSDSDRPWNSKHHGTDSAIESGEESEERTYSDEDEVCGAEARFHGSHHASRERRLAQEGEAHCSRWNTLYNNSVSASQEVKNRWEAWQLSPREKVLRFGVLLELLLDRLKRCPKDQLSWYAANASKNTVHFLSVSAGMQRLSVFWSLLKSRDDILREMAPSSAPGAPIPILGHLWDWDFQRLTEEEKKCFHFVPQKPPRVSYHYASAATGELFQLTDLIEIRTTTKMLFRKHLYHLIALRQADWMFHFPPYLPLLMQMIRDGHYLIVQQFLLVIPTGVSWAQLLPGNDPRSIVLALIHQFFPEVHYSHNKNKWTLENHSPASHANPPPKKTFLEAESQAVYYSTAYANGKVPDAPVVSPDGTFAPLPLTVYIPVEVRNKWASIFFMEVLRRCKPFEPHSGSKKTSGSSPHRKHKTTFPTDSSDSSGVAVGRKRSRTEVEVKDTLDLRSIRMGRLDLFNFLAAIGKLSVFCAALQTIPSYRAAGRFPIAVKVIPEDWEKLPESQRVRFHLVAPRAENSKWRHGLRSAKKGREK